MHQQYPPGRRRGVDTHLDVGATMRAAASIACRKRFTGMPWNDDREMELWEHLAELRSRIVRILIYLVLGAIVCWLVYDPLLAFIKRPLDPLSTKYHIKWIFIHIT